MGSTNIDSSVGKIHCLYCENFVTYDQVTARPGKYLNLILGPNGTGKSSLIAAIVLGMGGEPKLLSRATDIGDYVKNGKEKALIRIEIYIDDEGNTSMFQRSFGRNGKSVYAIDNTVVNHSQFLKHVAKYNIQVSNLCQFMPQDRVQDFAKMNPRELLNSTQEAICEPEMIEHLKNLKEMRGTQRDGDKTLGDKQKQLKELEERNAQLQDSIDKIQIRQQYLDDIAIGEKKRIWLQFDEIQNDFNSVKELIKKAKQELTTNQKKYNEMQARSNDILGQKDELTRILNTAKNEATQISAQLDKLDDAVTEHENSILQAERALKNKKSEMIEREKEIEEATRLYEGFVQDLKLTMQSCSLDFDRQLSAHNTAIESKKKEIVQLTDTRSDLNHDIDKFQPELNALRHAMNKIQNEGERRLNKLRDLNQDAYMGVEWLKRNRQLFNGHVYDPMILELRVKDAKNAMYIENAIQKRDLLAFVCTDKSDMSLLIQHLCDEQKLSVNVLHAHPADCCEYKSQTKITNELRKYGFYSYLLDMVEGPAPILNYLCEAFAIHKILVATDAVEKYAEQLPREITVFYSSRNKFRITTSRYTNQTSTVCSAIREQNLLSADIDEGRLNEIKRQMIEITRQTDDLKNKRSRVEAEINNCHEQVNQIVTLKKNVEAKKIQIQKKKRHVKFQEERMTKLKNLNYDIPQEEKVFEELCKTTIQQIIDVYQKKSKKLAAYEKALVKKQHSAIKLQVFRLETVEVEQQLSSAEEDYRNAKKRVESLGKTEKDIKTKFDEKKAEGLRLCDGKSPTDRSFPYQSDFAKLPNTLQELEERLVEMKTRAECMDQYKVDIQEYEARAKEIENLRKIIGQSKGSQENIAEKIKELHEKWYPYFSIKIAIISENFTRFMSLLEYAGEVKIIYNDVNDYDTYGIQILVQYRKETKLQVLDRFIQSGGERAVAIALYSMSLQNLTQVPFRCVDEINQGMDPGNERKVFNLIVDETCHIGSSQYFFVTPKLLPDLHWNELMTALIVFNGDLSSPDVFENTMP